MKKMTRHIIISSIFLLLGGSCYSNDYCRNMENRIRGSFDKLNYCQCDSDCKIADIDCPFGNTLINKNANTSNMKRRLLQYQKTCGICIYDIVTPKAKDIKCKNNKCID